MKVIISALAAILILTSCNSGSSGGSSKKKENPRVGEGVNNESSKLAKALAGKAYCGLETVEDEEGGEYREKFNFASSGEGSLELLDPNSFSVNASIPYQWGATETSLTIAVEGERIKLNANLKDDILTFSAKEGSAQYAYCGDATGEEETSQTEQDEDGTVTLPTTNNDLITNQYLCEVGGSDKFILLAETSKTGLVEVVTRHGSISGSYNVLSANEMVITLDGESNSIFYQKVDSDTMIMSFASGDVEDAQEYKVCN
jgi:hypothetical protein